MVREAGMGQGQESQESSHREYSSFRPGGSFKSVLPKPPYSSPGWGAQP
jgi:hypothetical protein